MNGATKDPRPITRRAHVQHANAARAVAELRAELRPEDSGGVLVFCSPNYDLSELGRELKAAFDVPIAGCTTAGQFGPDGFHSGGITAVSFAKANVTLQPHLISPLGDCEEQTGRTAVRAVRELSKTAAGRGFGVVLVDGLSLSEERLAAALYRSTRSISIIGGSAGDDLRFQRTFVYHDGVFRSDAALFVLFATRLPFATFRVQHVVPTEKRLVVTLADPERRVVYEIDGEPAADVYAAAVGVPVEALDSTVFQKHPLVLMLNGDPYVRAIQRVNPDLSLTLFCAIEAGLVLRLGTSTDRMTALRQGFSKMKQHVPSPDVVLGFDCVLRQRGPDGLEITAEEAQFLLRERFVGFSGYGEQFNALHLNQTLTAVAIGGPAA